MVNTLLGTKKGMTSAYDSRGKRVGATILKLGPNFITQIKTQDKDGYESVQLGFEAKKSVKKPQIGHLKKAGIEQKVRFLREVRSGSRNPEIDNSSNNLTLGQEVKVETIFKVGDSVKITATSKGRGFQGGVRRHGFHGGPKTHGQSDRHRAPGSIGAGTTPGRVLKGKKMAGHMGVETVSYLGLEVLSIDRLNSLITIKGGIPGPIGGLVTVQKQGRIKGYTPPPEEKPDEEEEQEANEKTESKDNNEAVRGDDAEAIVPSEVEGGDK